MNRMRVVFLSPTFTPQMSGYAGMALPKAMAKLGVEVHVIAGNLNVYYYLPEYKEIYEPFIGPAVTPCGEERIDGYTLHRLPHSNYGGQIRLRGLARKLRSIMPHVVHVWSAISLLPLEAAVWSKFFGYKLFTAQHNSRSTFGLATKSHISLKEKFGNFLLRFLQGRFISMLSEKCYAPTPDCYDIAVHFMGVVARKCAVRPLGVDTELFHPICSQEEHERRLQIRSRLGFAPDHIVCIYTGRLTPGKNPLCLAQAVMRLVEAGKCFRGLFIGSGPQKEILGDFQSSIVLPFVRTSELPGYYQAADVAVWPVEYTTSMLDAAACGIPIVISNQIEDRERVDGNGLIYAENDHKDLASALSQLEDASERLRLGAIGSAKMATRFSWLSVARKTLDDFYEAVERS